MSETQHTPGPWKLGQWGTIQTPKGQLLVSGVMMTTGNHPDCIEVAANDRLIAESPSLLKFAQWCVAQLQGDSGTGDTYWSQFQEYQDGLASIARAIGKDQA